MRSKAASKPLPQGQLTVDFVQSLRERCVRDHHGLFLAEGLRFLCGAVDAGLPIAGIATCKKLLHGPLPHTLINRLDVPSLELPESAFRRICASEQPQGVLLVIRQVWQRLPELVGPRDLWIGVEKVRSPGNLGTLMRTGAAVGATGLMIFGPPRDRADGFDPSCIRASMGACFQLKIVGTSHREFRSWRQRYELMVLGATGDAPRDYRQAKYRRPVMFMLGNERIGLSEAQQLTCDGHVRIPMSSGVDSLNVAMAGSVLLYEAWSQRHPLKSR